MARKKYRKEFFDREYKVLEAYIRVWKYIRKYKFRLLVGLFLGMATAGTLLPFYQMIQPAVVQVSSHSSAEPVVQSAADTAPKKTKLERKMADAAKIPDWFLKVEELAGRAGVKFRDGDGNMTGAMLFAILLLIPLVSVLRLTLGFLNGYCLTWAATHAVADMRCEMLRHVQNQSLQFFGRVDMGQLMTRVVSDPGKLSRIMTVILPELAIAPFSILISIGFIVHFAVTNEMVETLLLLVVGVPAFVLPIVALGRAIRRWAKKSLERSSVIGSKVHEVLTCIRIVKATNSESFEDRSYRGIYDYLMKSTMRTLRLGLLVGPLVETVGLMLIGAFLVWCFSKDVALANIVPMVAPVMMIYKPIKDLSKLQVMVQDSMAALSRIFSTLDLHMELKEPEDPVSKKAFNSEIRFENVTFRYAGADKDAVADATFTIPKGTTVAVVGSTGSGKSTLSGLLARFYDPVSGRVTLDGTDLRDIAQRDVHRLMGAVLQETVLFNDTIENNICYGIENVTHERMVEAAKLANAHDFIMAQPEGYKRKVGEKGFALSGGERQRIAIARAILLNPPILILDEATSALDTVTERLVQDALEKLMENRTIFVIAHRLSTVRNADLILVMDRGKIVERGTHDELIARRGVYHSLCNARGAVAEK
jgi:ABC-type multidrug transport system fused ATPase/permease subunit